MRFSPASIHHPARLNLSATKVKEVLILTPIFSMRGGTQPTVIVRVSARPLFSMNHLPNLFLASPISRMQTRNPFQRHPSYEMSSSPTPSLSPIVDPLPLSPLNEVAEGP